MSKLPTPMLHQLLDLACMLQQISSPTFSESEKAAFVNDQFAREGLFDVHTDASGNVLARWGGGTGRPLIISAHMDTVHPPQVKLTQRREENRVFGPAIGDNSLGVAALLLLPRLLRKERFAPPGSIWLVANTCEEGLGDLRGMRAIVDHFGSTPRAYLVLEGMGLGQIYHRGLGVERFRITARTAGGHSWVDYGKPSAIHALVGVAAQLAALRLPRKPRTSLNVGTIEGGTTINTIAAFAQLDLDMRSEDHATLQELAGKVRQIVEQAAQEGVSFEVKTIGMRPGGEIPHSHALVRLAEDCLRQEGVTPRIEIASTDANVPLSRGLPAVCIGLTTGGGAHTTAEFIDIPPLRQGISQLMHLVTRVWDALPD